MLTLSIPVEVRVWRQFANDGVYGIDPETVDEVGAGRQQINFPASRSRLDRSGPSRTLNPSWSSGRIPVNSPARGNATDG